jgi:ubiquinone/menaquinone biosynthesis C-methylase UbiE
MKTNNIDKINSDTKKAWGENWEATSIETILEIFDYPRVNKLLNTITLYIPKKGAILEAGCGLGPWVIKLGMMGYDVVGVDYQEECIKKIKEYDGKQKVYVADVVKMPFDDNSFSAYLSWGVIEHFVEGPDAALKEAHRVLEKGGRLILTVPYKNIFRKVIKPIIQIKRNPLVRKLFNKPMKTYYYQRYFKLKELKYFITKHGFAIESIVPVDHIFSLVEFSDIFRNKSSFHGENKLGVYGGRLLEKVLPWLGAGSTLIIANKI